MHKTRPNIKGPAGSRDFFSDEFLEAFFPSSFLHVIRLEEIVLIHKMEKTLLISTLAYKWETISMEHFEKYSY